MRTKQAVVGQKWTDPIWDLCDNTQRHPSEFYLFYYFFLFGMRVSVYRAAAGGGVW
jgi:hypothetical protein